MKTRACLLKAVCFAFDFVGEWRSTIQKKSYKNFNDTQKFYGQAYFCSKKLFYMPTATYIKCTITTSNHSSLNYWNIQILPYPKPTPSSHSSLTHPTLPRGGGGRGGLKKIRPKRPTKFGRNDPGPQRPRAETTQAETTQGRNDSGPKRLRAETTRNGPWWHFRWLKWEAF